MLTSGKHYASEGQIQRVTYGIIPFMSNVQRQIQTSICQGLKEKWLNESRVLLSRDGNVLELEVKSCSTL